MSPSKGPQRLGEILRDFFERSGLSHRLEHLELYGVWEQVVGPDIARRTRVAGFKSHKLYVDVDSAAHLHELRTFGKEKILADLRDHLPSLLVQDIVFRPGPPKRS
jgi:predicted nucleic acid-binding Zn ribbon protein